MSEQIMVPGEVVASDGAAQCVYVGDVDGVPYGKVVEGEQEWEPLPLPSILARMGWVPSGKRNDLARWF